MLNLGMYGFLYLPPVFLQSVLSNLSSTAASLQTGSAPNTSAPTAGLSQVGTACHSNVAPNSTRLCPCPLSPGRGQLVCVPTWCCLQCPRRTLTPLFGPRCRLFNIGPKVGPPPGPPPFFLLVDLIDGPPPL